MTPGDFKQLSDPHQFEALTRALLDAMGFEILQDPGIGPDGGCDMMANRRIKDDFHEVEERVLVQCKHRALSGKAVDDAVLGNWATDMIRHQATGYLLVTDTRVTTNVSKAFHSFTGNPANGGKWARAVDVDQLMVYLNKYPRIKETFFPWLPPNNLRAPADVIKLMDDLEKGAKRADSQFDKQEWQEFSETVRHTRESLANFANRERHFELYFHFRRLPRFHELQRLLYGQQLAFERVIEMLAVDRVMETSANLKSSEDVQDALSGIDDFHEKAFSVVRQETEHLNLYTQGAKKMVMVGCGAFPHTLIHTCLTRRDWECTGVDHDNTSIILALKVRDSLNLRGRLHYITQNGCIFDYSDHDVVMVANIVSPKFDVLRRVVETAKEGAIIVLRNPVTFGEVLWEDARYTALKGIEVVERFDSNALGQCFETVILRTA
jgi:hypothetical protein